MVAPVHSQTSVRWPVSFEQSCTLTPLRLPNPRIVQLVHFFDVFVRVSELGHALSTSTESGVREPSSFGHEHAGPSAANNQHIYWRQGLHFSSSLGRILKPLICSRLAGRGR